jgi:hypothetical protein
LPHSGPGDDLDQAERLERLGDAAAGVDESATTYYRQAQVLLLPPGARWTDRAAYERRMEAFERIQQKLYGLVERGISRGFVAPEPAPTLRPPGTDLGAPALPVSTNDSPADASAALSVWNFPPGLVLRIGQAFVDYDGQQIHAGEILHFIDSSYFFYEGGHTLRFAEKTIRLASIVSEHEPIIANAGNAWFEPLDGLSDAALSPDLKA